MALNLALWESTVAATCSHDKSREACCIPLKETGINFIPLPGYKGH